MSEFVSLTQCESKTAKDFLRRNQWKLEYALNDYYDQMPGGFIEEPHTPVTYPEELLALYDKYVLEDQNKIDIDGMIQLIEDLDYKLEDLVTICLAKLLHCTRLADGISKDQFLHNWYMQGCSTLPQMRHVLDDLDTKLHIDLEYMTDIYNYTFDLALDQNKRDLDTDTAAEYWRLFFQPGTAVHVNPALLNSWLAFLDSEQKTVVTRDTWKMLLEFFKQFPSLSAVKTSYNEADAWPYIIDEYYEYLEDSRLI